MVKISGLRTAIYKVGDIEAAKQWYTKAFGTAPYFDQPFYVGFNIEGYELGLQPDASAIAKGESVAAYWAAEDVPSTYVISSALALWPTKRRRMLAKASWLPLLKIPGIMLLA
jgi:hypothetical protein